MDRIGTIKSLRRYPVKSMAGEDLQEARVTFSGLLGDRVYAFLDINNKSGFPWMTGRQGHELILYRPRWNEPLRSDNESPYVEQYGIEVETPEGNRFRIEDEEFREFLEKRFGRSLRLRFSERSMMDSRPVSILGMSSIEALSQETGMRLDLRRFRENLYVEWEQKRPYFEDELIGRELQVGETVMLQVVKKNKRCVMITLDPETSTASPHIFERVVRGHDSCMGVYGVVLREGIVRTDDAIYAV